MTAHDIYVTVRDLDPLCAADGFPFDPRVLPCTAAPAMWDADATPGQHAEAVAGCRRCPALAACAAKRLRCGHGADGVWAGKIIRRRPRPGDVDQIIGLWRLEAPRLPAGRRAGG